MYQVKVWMILLFFGSMILPLKAQKNFEVIKINAAMYPEVTATFLATDNQGNKIFNARPHDFIITENNQTAEVIDVQNPSVKPMPVSVVLVFDNSLSMAGSRLKMAIKAGKYFVEQMPLETSEIAIASFSDHVYVNCDFTQDPERLNTALDAIKPVSGTNYREAFMNNTMGSLNVAKNGQYKKYVILLTDGLSHTDAEEIISRAKNENITVFCITLELVTPQILKDISTKTGGTYFQTNANSSQLDAIYGTIFQMLEVVRYGKVIWKAPMDCEPQRMVNLIFRTIPVKLTYPAPLHRTGGLEVDPSQVFFGAAFPGVTKNLSVDLVARNIPISLTKLAFSPKSPFGISDSIKLPYVIKPNETKNFTLTYKAISNKQIIEKLIISSKECDDKSVLLTGGTDEELKLICPKGGEIFTVDLDTSIRWAGIRKDKTIEMLFRTNPKTEWRTIGQATGFSPWRIPMDTSRQAQIKIRTVASADDKLHLTSTIPNQKSGLRNAFFNNKGTQVITTDNSGTIKVWDVSNGMPVNMLKGLSTPGTAFFSEGDQHVVLATKNEIATWSVETEQPINRQYIRNKAILAQLTLPDGTIKLISTALLKDKANTLKLWRPETNHTKFIFENNSIKSAGMSMDATRAVTIDNEDGIKIWNLITGQAVKSKLQPISLQSIVISPNSKTALINAIGSVTIMDMTTGAALHENKNMISYWYSKSGDMLISKPTSTRFLFSDTYTGKPLLDLYKSGYFETLSKYNILFYRNDSLSLYNAQEKKMIYQKYLPSVSYIMTSPDEKKVMVVYQSNVMEILDADYGTRINRIGNTDGSVQSVLFSPDNKSVLAVMRNQSLQYWSPEGNANTKEAVSKYFSIVSPKPLVKKEIKFNEQLTGELQEMVVPDFLSNTTPYPIKITNIEIFATGSNEYEIVSETGPFVLEPKTVKIGEFRFKPNTTGFKEARIRTCTPRDTFITILSGTGIENSINITSRIIRFGKVKVTTTRDTLATIIRNMGNTPIFITKIENSGPDLKQFILLQNKSVKVSPGDSLNIAVSFSPVYRGKASGSLQVFIDGLAAPRIIHMEGEGIASRNVWITGKTLNSSDSLPTRAKVKITDLASNTTVAEIQTDTRGTYKYKVNTDRNYGIAADKEGYLSTSENIDVRSATLADTIHRDIYLTQIRAGAMIRMNCIFFEFAKANLLPLSRSELNRIADFMSAHKTMVVELHGHTDSIGTDAANIILSDRRANTVRDYLIKQGVSPAQLSIKAFGESKPVSANTTEEGRQLNRRVEMKILQ